LISIFGDLVERNISKRVLFSTLIVAIAIALLDLLFTFISEISDLNNSYVLIDALIYSLNSVPGSIYTYLSYICLLGVLIGLGSLKEEGELIASRVLGKSNIRIVIASLKPTFLIIVLGLIFQELYLPSISQSNEETRLIKQNKISTEDGYWFVSESSINFFASSPNKKKVTDVSIYKLGDQNTIKQIIKSDSASRLNDQWILSNVQVNDFEDNAVNYLDFMNWYEGPKDSDMRRILSPKYLSLRELNQALSDEESQLRKNKLLLEYWRKIFHPITTVLLTLLAASFIFGSVRDNSLGKRILIGILFAFSLNTIQSLFQSMASVSLLNPFNSVFLPMLIVLLITMVLWNLKTQES